MRDGKMLAKSTARLSTALKAVLVSFALMTVPGLARAADSTEGVPNYIIGPGDSLQIFVWHNPDLSATVPVRPDGRVTIPLVEDIPCTGRTPTQLARDIEERLRKFVQDPTVTVIMNGFIGPYSQQIRIVGQAAQPKALQYRANMTVLDAMIEVGGLTTFAAGNRAKLMRNGEQAGTTVRLEDLLEDGDLSANMPLQPGDIILIPQSFF